VSYIPSKPSTRQSPSPETQQPFQRNITATSTHPSYKHTSDTSSHQLVAPYSDNPGISSRHWRKAMHGRLSWTRGVCFQLLFGFWRRRAGRDLLWRVWLFSVNRSAGFQRCTRSWSGWAAYLFTLFADHVELRMSGIYFWEEKRRDEATKGLTRMTWIKPATTPSC
jgi:hypothetical protein